MKKENLLSDAIKLYGIKKYKDANDLFKKLTKDFSEANYYLGLLNFYGYYPKQDYKTAFKYFKVAWEGLYPDAIYMLGRCYEEGKGIDKNPLHAFKLYEAAAKSESIEAALKVAKFYEQGTVIEKSLPKAIEIYVGLTKKNIAYAMYKIGVFYLTGEGLKKSMTNAYSWLNKALASGSIEAMNYFRYLGSKSKTDIRSTEEMLLTGQAFMEREEYEEAIPYFEIAAKEKSLKAVFILSDLYKQGKGVEKSLEKAFNILLQFKDLDEPELYLKIAKKYEMGEGIDSSYIKASKFYELAAAKGSERAKQELFAIRGY